MQNSIWRNIMNVLITGAAGGLGRAFVNECVRRHFNVCAIDINESGLHQIKEGILQRFDCDILTYPCDITNNDSIQSLMVFLKKNTFEVNMLLNVAGVDYEGGFLTRQFDDLKKIVDINILGSMRITHEILNMHETSTRFYLIFIASLAAEQPIPLKATYAASKRFLLDFSRAIAEELKEETVSVLTVCPGGLATTEEIMYAIQSQGFFGSITTCRMERLVRRTIDKSLKKRVKYVPGIFNRLTVILNRIIPMKYTMKILHKRWKDAQKRWLRIK